MPYYIKDELAKVILERDCCKLAEMSALIKSEGTLHLIGGRGLALHTESENPAVARLIINLAKDLFGRTPELSIDRPPRLRHHNCYYLYFGEGESVAEMLRKLGILDGRGRPRPGIPVRLLSRKCCKGAYLRGVFLGCGFLGDMNKNKHLEFSLGNEEMAEGIMRLLKDLGIQASAAQRRSSQVVYLKKKENIIALLALMGAYVTVLDIENDLIIRSIKGEVNRRVNCETANLRRTARAAQEQIRNIHAIDEALGIDALTPSLRSVARARLRYPDLSIEELGKKMDPPLSKSATYHRLIRLSKLARQL